MGIGKMVAVPVRVVDFDVVDIAADSMCNVDLFTTMCIAVPVRVVDKGSQSEGGRSRMLFTGSNKRRRESDTSS